MYDSPGGFAMLHRILFVLLLGAVVFAPAQEKLDLSVLYAGDPGPRTEEWLTFLRARVRAVSAIERGKLTTETAKDAGVVIIDAETPYKESGIKLPRGAKLKADFAKPTILMGAAGGSTLGSLNIKLDWL